MLKYIEKCTGTSHNGPAWIAHVQFSKSGQTVYFNGMALKRAKGGLGVGNHYDLETGDPYWVSGVKRRGSNRHWAGSGRILIEAAAVDEYLHLTGQPTLDPERFEITTAITPPNPNRFVEIENDPGEYEQFRFPDLEDER